MPTRINQEQPEWPRLGVPEICPAILKNISGRTGAHYLYRILPIFENDII